MEVILGDPDRLEEVARDFIQHSEKRVEEGATVLKRRKVHSKKWESILKRKLSMTS